MLNMGFREDIETILEYIPEPHQTILFSATMPKPILEITKKYQKDAVTIKVVKKELTVPSIDQFYYDVKRKEIKEIISDENEKAKKERKEKEKEKAKNPAPSGESSVKKVAQLFGY